MIMAKNSNNNYVNIEDIKTKNNNEYQDIEKIVSKQGNLLYNKYKETEDTLPINFKGKGKDLKNYRIYGNTVNGESVGDRTGNLVDKTKFVYGYRLSNIGTLYTTPSEQNLFAVSEFIEVNSGEQYIISQRDAIRGYGRRISFYQSKNENSWLSNNDDSDLIFTVPNTATYLRFTALQNYIDSIMLIRGTSLPTQYEPYGYKVPVTVEGKNLLQNTAASTTKNGVTFTVNSDGSVTCNGTADKAAWFDINRTFDVYSPDGRIASIGNQGSLDTFYMNIGVSGIGAVINSYKYSKTTHDIAWVHIVIASGYTCDNLTLYPMIRKADIEDDTYEPYHAPVTTPIYLPEQIKKVGDEAEYVDYAEQKQHRVRKNLFDKNGVWVNGYINDNGELAENNAIATYTEFINVKPDTDYSLICDSSVPEGVRFNYYDSSKNFISRLFRNMNNPKITTPSTCEYITLSVNKNQIQYLMIVEGSTAPTEYEPYIENTDLDVILPALPTLRGTNVLSVGTAVQPSKVYLKGKLKGKIYGWHVDPDISDSSNAVTYLKDAIGMTPASMGSSTFDYGSWKNAFFMPKPCMLKSNGKVDYYLDPNDYTKKLNGAPSDISNPNYDGNAMMQWPKIWFKYVKGVKEGQGYFYVANYKADGNFHCWCNYDSENNEIDHFYTAIYNGTSFANYSSSKTYVINDFAIYDNKLYKCNTAITTVQAFDSAKWNVVSNTAPIINKMRSLSGIRLTSNNGNAQTNTITEVTRAEANNTTVAKEWHIETFSDRLLINGLLVLMGKSLNTQAIFGRGLDSGSQSAKEAYITGALNDKGLFYGVTGNGNSAVKVFGMENFWGCVWNRIAGLITNNHAIKLKLTYGTKDGSTVVGYNQTGNGYIDNGISPYADGYVQKMSYNKYGFIPAVITGRSQSTYYADYHYQNATYTGIIYALFGGSSGNGLSAGAFYLNLGNAPESADWYVAASLSCKPLLN